MTEYRGTLQDVTYTPTKSEKPRWYLDIDTDEKGSVVFQMWDKTYAGLASKEHEALCDVNEWVGKRVVFQAKKGSPKSNDPQDLWPPTIHLISLEEEQPTQSVREMAAEIEAEKPSDEQKSTDAPDLNQVLMDWIAATSRLAEVIQQMIRRDDEDLS